MEEGTTQCVSECGGGEGKNERGKEGKREKRKELESLGKRAGFNNVLTGSSTPPYP